MPKIVTSSAVYCKKYVQNFRCHELTHIKNLKKIALRAFSPQDDLRLDGGTGRHARLKKLLKKYAKGLASEEYYIFESRNDRSSLKQNQPHGAQWVP